ncbi:MAG: Fe-S cluster assembly protein SufD [Thiobacillus sp.]|nr:Fe-S cluster assembly protein SufD [Thiobacillus sp.]
MTADTPFIEALRRIEVPGWPAGQRGAALDRFLTTGMPSTRLEAWKHTSLEALERLVLHSPNALAGESVCPDIAAYPGHALMFQNGQLSCHGTYLAKQIAGTLNHLADTQPVHRYLGKVADDTALASLNLALWQDGARVYLPADEHVSLPIFALYGAAEAEAMLYPRTLAVLEHGAEATLVEHYLGQTGQPYWQDAVTEIVLEDGARLTHLKVIEEGAAASHTSLTAVRLGRDSEYRALHIGLDGALVRHEITVDMAGPGATTQINAFDLADGHRHADLHLRVNHRAPSGTSRIAYRGMADDHGRAVFDGHVVVDRAAQQTDARQSCRGLLLSAKAEIDAMPRLEIYADDVKCGHGASIGNLDRDALFYLQSRGIDLALARRMLMQGFAAEVLGLVEHTHLRDWLMPRLLAAMARSTVPEPMP